MTTDFQSQGLLLAISVAINVAMFILNFYQARTNRSALHVVRSQHAVGVRPIAYLTKDGQLTLGMKNAGPGVVISLRGSCCYANTGSHGSDFDPTESFPFETGAIAVGETITALVLGNADDLRNWGNALRVSWEASNPLGQLFQRTMFVPRRGDRLE